MTNINVQPCVPCYKYIELDKLDVGDFFHLNGDLYMVSTSVRMQNNIKCICFTRNTSLVHLKSIHEQVAIVRQVNINYLIEPDISKDKDDE